jgi:hypothetical protein
MTLTHGVVYKVNSPALQRRMVISREAIGGAQQPGRKSS